MSLQPMHLRNVPDFLDWTFPDSNMQDHKGKQKIQGKYLQWNLAARNIWRNHEMKYLKSMIKKDFNMFQKTEI